MTIDGIVRVAQLLDTLNVGGKERVAANLANGLAKAGFDSHVIASRNLGPISEVLDKDVNLYCAERTGRFDLAGIKRIAAHVDDCRIDIIHSHNQTSGYLARILKRFCRSRFLHVVHDHSGPGLNSRKQALLDKLMLRHVDAYISVSEALHRRSTKLLKLPSDRCVYLDNGIEIPPQHKPFSGRPTVIQVANLHGPKDHATAMRAAAILKRSIPELRWRCVGRTPKLPNAYMDEVNELIDSLGLDECVELLGERSDVPDLLREAHVGVLTSLAEGLPLSVLEYMAAQLPVVLTETGQTPGIVRNAGCGTVVCIGDASGIAHALLEIFQDPNCLLRLGSNGRSYVKKHFGVDRMVQTVCDLYTGLLASREAG